MALNQTGKGDRNRQHDSAGGSQGITYIYWTGNLSWKVYPSPSYSVWRHSDMCVRRTFPTTGDQNMMQHFQIRMRCFDTTTVQSHSSFGLMLRRTDLELHCCKPMTPSHSPLIKSLTETESCYSNIERELLGIVFGFERFHQYVYGRHMEVHTDHKPLESIYTKHIFTVPPRLARMLLRIQQYDVSIKL